MAHRIVAVVEFVVLAAVVVTIVLLFTNQPTQAPSPEPAVVEAAGGIDGSSLYADRCASCHGGDGSGGIGPRLSGRVLDRFPEPADEIAVVAAGTGSMPSFAGRLTDEEIAAVVDYTRTVLSGR